MGLKREKERDRERLSYECIGYVLDCTKISSDNEITHEIEMEVINSKINYLDFMNDAIEMFDFKNTHS